MDYLVRFLSALYSYLGEAAPYLVIGYLLVALFREYVPRRVLTRHLGGRGARPLVNALGMGALLPVCSCGAIPLGVGLVHSGAALGTTLTFMTSAPAISPVSVIVGYTLLGLPLLLVYVVAALIGSVLLGAVGNCWLRAPNLAAVAVAPERTGAPCDDCCPPAHEAVEARHWAKIRSAVRWAYWDLGSDVSLNLLVGLAIAAAVVAFLPADWIAAAFGQQHWWSLIYVILVAIPIYTCSVPSLFVIHGLLLLGASPGAAIAFLVAGPATNLGELNAIRGAMGARTALYYAVSLVAISFVSGMITDHVLFRADQFQAPMVDGQWRAGAGWVSATEGIPAWHYPFMVILAAVLVWGVARRAGRFRQR